MATRQRTADDDLAEKVCAEGDCTNRAQNGTIYCYQHLFGADVPAPGEAIEAKRRLRRELAKGKT